MEKKYTKEHEWILAEGGSYKVGITHYAQEQLGDVVMVELPNVSQSYNAGDVCAVVESVKAASDIYAPISGEVTAVNEQLADQPELLNQDPEGEGWLWIMNSADGDSLADLMDEQAYLSFVEE